MKFKVLRNKSSKQHIIKYQLFLDNGEKDVSKLDMMAKELVVKNSYGVYEDDILDVLINRIVRVFLKYDKKKLDVEECVESLYDDPHKTVYCELDLEDENSIREFIREIEVELIELVDIFDYRFGVKVDYYIKNYRDQ
jgi:hypothetical protein